VQSPRCKIPKFKVQSPKCKVRKCKVQSAKVQSAKCKVRDSERIDHKEEEDIKSEYD